MDQLDALTRVIDDVVAPNAAAVDKNSTYPRMALDALGSAGIFGLASASELGGGGGLDAAATVVERLAHVCGSTALVMMMHYSGTAVIEALGPRSVRKTIAACKHVTTLAFSEAGSRSPSLTPLSTATADADGIRLDASKRWITSAGEANSYVWSSKPVNADGPALQRADGNVGCGWARVASDAHRRTRLLARVVLAVGAGRGHLPQSPLVPRAPCA